MAENPLVTLSQVKMLQLQDHISENNNTILCLVETHQTRNNLHI